MPSVDFLKSVPIVRSPRVMQLEGLFDVAPNKESRERWTADLPIEDRIWNIGLIVGPSGCGKTTLAGELFPGCVAGSFEWPADRSLVDAFPEALEIREVTRLLTSVGFASVPSWLRPFRVLSNGEQFRATLARALAEGACRDSGHNGIGSSAQKPLVIDEFTSVVDRTVARIGSAAVAKTVRRLKQKFVAVSCHEDIIDWLNPDWIYEPAGNLFQWRYERLRKQSTENGKLPTKPNRPNIRLTVCRVHHETWRLFHRHHYLSGRLNRAAVCFAGFIENQPAVFAAVLPFPHPHRPGWREHRLVCLPDYQGVGVGTAMSEFVASLFRASGRPYSSTTSNPGLIKSRAASKKWIMRRKPSRASRRRSHNTVSNALQRTAATNRLTAGFEYVGPSRPHEARGFGLKIKS